MMLLSQHLAGLMPFTTKHLPVRVQPAESPFTGPPAPQSQTLPVTPVAPSGAAQLTPDQHPRGPLREREQHELQSLLRNMQGIEPPQPKGERVDLLVPRPSSLDP